MPTQRLLVQEPKILPPLEPDFRPVSLGDAAFLKAAKPMWVEVPIAYEREDGLISRGDTRIIAPLSYNPEENL